MTDAYRNGDPVKWNWGSGEGRGTVEEAHSSRVAKTIKGANIARDASDDCPAYTIRQEDGDTVLKSHSEVTKA